MMRVSTPNCGPIVHLGWTAIHVRSATEGHECGYRDLIVILHELGHALASVPFLASSVLATGALVAAATASCRSAGLTALASGAAIGSVALAAADGSYEIDDLTVGLVTENDGNGCSGCLGVRLDADLADFLVVAARNPDGETLPS